MVFFSLFFNQKLAKTIFKVLNIELSTFLALKLLLRIQKSSFNKYVDIIVLIIFSISIETCILFFLSL